ncbi:MAG: CRISPR-associated protein Cas5 [Pirellulaceae bacterium]
MIILEICGNYVFSKISTLVTKGVSGSIQCESQAIAQPVKHPSNLRGSDMPKSYCIELEIAGPTAMWTRPDTGDAPVSFLAPTYSAAKGILESIATKKRQPLSIVGKVI